MVTSFLLISKISLTTTFLFGFLVLFTGKQQRLLSPLTLTYTKMEKAIDTFRNEFKYFQNQEKHFGVKAHWNYPDAVNIILTCGTKILITIHQSSR